MLKKIRQTGWVYSFAIVFNRIVPESLLRYRGFYVYQLDVDAEIPPHANVKTEVCQSPESFAAAETETYYQRRENDIAILARFDDSVAGAMWAVAQRFPEVDLGVEMVLEPQQAWLFAAQVNKSFRRRGIHRQILGRLMLELSKRGHRHQLVSVNPHNVGSNMIHRKASFRTMGYVRTLKIFNIAFCTVSGDMRRDRWVTWNAKGNPIQIVYDTSDPPVRESTTKASEK